MIDRQLKKDYAKNAKIAKLLLLGAGESGKSTIVKQMKLLYPVNNRDSAGFSEDEKEETKFAIYSNILDSILALLNAVRGNVCFKKTKKTRNSVISHSSKSISVIKLSFNQNESSIGGSFWQKESLITHTLFELCPS